MPFTLTRIVADKVLDELITDITVEPMWSGQALVSYMAAGRLHYAWYWPETNQLKVLSDDLFPDDTRKDAGTGAIWDTPHGLACLVAHTTDATGSGSSARLYGGTMDAPWVKAAREDQLIQMIDSRASAIVQAALQQGSGGSDQDTIAALQARVASLEAQLGALQTLAGRLTSRMADAGVAPKGE